MQRDLRRVAGGMSVGLAVTCLAAGAAAEMVRQTVPVEIVTVGGYCDRPPDELLDAPATSAGVIEHSFSPNRYVELGDKVAARVGMGIGLRVGIEGLGPGDAVVMRVEEPYGHRAEWDGRIAPSGRLEFGQIPDHGKAMDQGPYLFSVLSEGRVVFTYRIQVNGVAQDDLCVPEVS